MSRNLMPAKSWLYRLISCVKTPLLNLHAFQPDSPDIAIVSWEPGIDISFNFRWLRSPLIQPFLSDKCKKWLVWLHLLGLTILLHTLLIQCLFLCNVAYHLYSNCSRRGRGSPTCQQINRYKFYVDNCVSHRQDPPCSVCRSSSFQLPNHMGFQLCNNPILFFQAVLCACEHCKEYIDLG